MARMPVNLYATAEQEASLPHNRRYLMKDGKVVTNPGFLNPDVVCAVGPIDPRVFVLYTESGGREPLLTWVNYTLHPDTVGGTWISADYPFYLGRLLARVKAERIVNVQDHFAAEALATSLAPLNRFPRMVQEYFVEQLRRFETPDHQAKAALETKADAKAYVASVRERTKAGFGVFPEKTPLNPRITGAVDRDAYRIEKVIFESRPELFVTGNQQVLVGEFLGAWHAWDGIRALDYLLSRPEVDPRQLGVTGNSGGGTLTTWLCGVEPRWTMAAPSCFVTAFRHNLENELPADTEQCPPRALALGLDHEDFLAAMAPKPVLILAKEKDFFDIRGTEAAYARLKELYGRLGAADNIAMSVGPTPQGYSRESREAMYRWFNRITRSRTCKRNPL